MDTDVPKSIGAVDFCRIYSSAPDFVRCVLRDVCSLVVKSIYRNVTRYFVMTVHLPQSSLKESDLFSRRANNRKRRKLNDLIFSILLSCFWSPFSSV